MLVVRTPTERKAPFSLRNLLFRELYASSKCTLVGDLGHKSTSWTLESRQDWNETDQAVHLGSAKMKIVDAVKVHILDMPAEERLRCKKPLVVKHAGAHTSQDRMTI